MLWWMVACWQADPAQDNDPEETEQQATCDSEVPEPQAFACGDEGLTCTAGTQYCLEEVGGVPDTAGYAIVWWSCKAMPADCLECPTCDCMEGRWGIDTGHSEAVCAVDSDGAMTVGIAYP